MTQPAVATAIPEIDLMRESAKLADLVLKMNMEGLTHEESLIQPGDGANCLNWVVGHLACVYNNVLPLLGQEPVRDKAALQRYDRGSAPLTDRKDATNLQELLQIWEEAAKRIDAGLQTLTPARLAERAPFSPRDNPNETVRSLLTVVIFHQAYHVGQTGLLRRKAGKKGALA